MEERLMEKNEDKRFIKVATTRWIPELRSDGPIVNPLKVPAKTVLSIMNHGYKVIEVAPFVDPKTKRRPEITLTLSNIFDPDRFGKKEEPVAPMPKEHLVKFVGTEEVKVIKEVPQPKVVVKEEPVVVAVEEPVITENDEKNEDIVGLASVEEETEDAAYDTEEDNSTEEATQNINNNQTRKNKKNKNRR